MVPIEHRTSFEAFYLKIDEVCSWDLWHSGHLLTLFIEGYTIGDAPDHNERRILIRKGCLAGLHLTNQCFDILRFYLARTGPRLGFHCVLRNREDSHQVREVSQSASFVDPSFQSGRQSVLWEWSIS
jgi:hypothetical protein